MQHVDVSLSVCRRCTSSQFASYMKRAYRYKILVPMLLMCQLSAYLSAKDAPLDCSQLASYMKRVCMQKDMSTCPNAFDVSTVSLSVSKRCTFGLFPASYMKRVCLQKDMSTCPKAVVVSTVSIFVSMSQVFSRTIPWQTIIKPPHNHNRNHNFLKIMLYQLLLICIWAAINLVYMTWQINDHITTGQCGELLTVL